MTEGFIFSGLPHDLQEHVLSFKHPWFRMSHWQQCFTRDVLPCLNKGYRLVRCFSTSWGATRCMRCYEIEGSDLCAMCVHTATDAGTDTAVISFEEYCFSTNALRAIPGSIVVSNYDELLKYTGRAELSKQVLFNIRWFGPNWWKKTA